MLLNYIQRQHRMGTTATNASMFDNETCPDVIPIEQFYNSKYNCLMYELIEPDKSKTFCVVCADTLGIYGHGCNAEKAVKLFRKLVELRILEKLLGGIFVGTSDFDYQEKIFKKLESVWKEDGIEILNKTRITICLWT